MQAQLYVPNCQTNLFIVLNTTAYNLGWYEPSPPATKELHGLTNQLIAAQSSHADDTLDGFFQKKRNIFLLEHDVGRTSQRFRRRPQQQQKGCCCFVARRLNNIYLDVIQPSKQMNAWNIGIMVKENDHFPGLLNGLLFLPKRSSLAGKFFISSQHDFFKLNMAFLLFSNLNQYLVSILFWTNHSFLMVYHYLSSFDQRIRDQLCHWADYLGSTIWMISITIISVIVLAYFKMSTEH